MTTIACDGKSMAGDGMVINRADMVCGLNTEKVARLDDGSIIGSCGDFIEIQALVAWLNGGEKPDVSNCSALVLKPDGRVFYHEGASVGAPAELPAAIGSGAALAMGAMLAGASPGKAVMIAAERDVYTGGTITVLSIEPAVKAAA